MSTHNQPPTEPPATRRVTFFTIFASICSSFIGIQNNANRQRDFASGQFWHFFVAGLIFVALLVGGIVLGVRYLLATAGG